jgi:hypothetical protein
MLPMVLCLSGRGRGQDIPSLSKGHSFKDVANRKTFAIVPTHLPSVYIIEELEEVPTLEVMEEIVSNLLSYYESNALIYRFNGF